MGFLATTLVTETSPQVSSLLLCPCWLSHGYGIPRAAPTVTHSPVRSAHTEGALQGCAKTLATSTAPDPLQGLEGGAAWQRRIAHPRPPWLWWVSGTESGAGMGHRTANSPCRHAAVRGDGAVGTCSQGSAWPQPPCPVGHTGSPQSDGAGTCSGPFLQPSRRCCEFELLQQICVAGTALLARRTTAGMSVSVASRRPTVSPCARLPGCRKSCPQEAWETVTL